MKTKVSSKARKGYFLWKRLFDLFVSSLGILVLSPLFLAISVKIKLDSQGTVFFKQQRIGKEGKSFYIIKFRTMSMENQGSQITVGGDKRITQYGAKLRESKLDELPQLFNVWIGNMSLVGPRPEVPRYVAFYTEEQKKVLEIKPGITDLASIEFRNESELLAKADDPETYYVEKIIPAKIGYSLRYMEQMSLCYDLKMIIGTLKALRRNYAD